MDLLVYILYIFLHAFIPIFPLRFSQFMAKLWGKIFYYFIPIRKKAARDNIKLCFPDVSKKETNKIIKEAYINVITVIFEFQYFTKLDDDTIKKIVKIKYPNHIKEELVHGKGLIIISAHFGNWELMAYGGGKIFNEPIHVIVKEQTNKKIDKKINAIREYKGNKMIEMRQSVREVLRLMKENKAVAMLGDQSAPAENSIKVNFFIPDVPMFEGPARFAIKTGAQVFFGIPFRNNDGTYNVDIIDIDMSKYAVYNEENIKALTQEHASLLEAAIRKRPGHWLWFHRKFKHILTYK